MPRLAIAVLALVASLILPRAALAAGGWHAQTSGTQQDLTALAAVNGGHLWAVGTGGTILISVDWGAAWLPETSGTMQDLRAIAFTDGSHGWAVGDGGTILGTVDGGASWTAQTSTVTQDLRAIAFSDGSHGWAVGDGGTILSTVDGGTSWTAQTSTVTQDLYGVACSGTSGAWAVGAGGIIVATSDGGATWTRQTSTASQDLHAIAFADGTHGWAVGADGVIAATRDAGATWTTQASGSTWDLAGVDFVDPLRGWAVGAGGLVLYTANGGAAWTAQSSNTATDLGGVAFADAQHGAIVGAGGVILTTSDAGIVDTIAPHTTTTGLQAKSSTGWRNAAQTVTLQAHDSGSGAAITRYTLDGGARQTYSAPFLVSAAGSHVVKYWSLDWAGNVEAKHTGFVNIDVGRPTCVAIRNVQAYPGTSATFSLRVNDPKPTCGFGDVRITIYKRGTVKARFKLSRVTLNEPHSRTYRLTLPAGAYTWTVTATDLAGNTQVRTDTAKLKVIPRTIAQVQRCLVALRYLPSGAVTGVSDYRTSQALIAFQAWNGLTRDGVADLQTRTRLVSVSAPRPRPESVIGHYVQVYRSLGVVLCVDSGTLVRAVHCSAGRPGLETPPGLWHVYLKTRRFWSQEYSSLMTYVSWFRNGAGLHGYADVPAYPASHGCVRLPMPEAPWVYEFAAMRTPVYVY